MPSLIPHHHWILNVPHAWNPFQHHICSQNTQCFSAKPKLAQWEAAKCVLRYIQATKDMELRFDGTELSLNLNFHGYTDVGWSQDPDNTWSTSGFLFMSNHGPISWSSKQQSMVVLSTTESEYIELSNAGQHLAWL